MSNSVTPENVYAFLRESILFKDAADHELQVIATRLELVTYHAADAIVLEHQVSDHVYFVYSGTVEVVKHLKELNQLHRLAILGPGRQFSEFSVLNRSTKGASVFALEDCELLRMSGDNFLQVLHEFPLVAKRLVLHLAEMTHYINSSKLKVTYVNTDQIDLHDQVPELLPSKNWRRNGVLPLRYENRRLTVAVKDLANRAFFQQMKSAFPQLHFYLHLINDSDFDALEKELIAAYDELKKSGQRRTPSKPPVEPLAGDITAWLRGIGLFQELPEDWIPQLAGCFAVEQIKAGQMIYKKGEASEKFYLLQSGEVAVLLPTAFDNASAHIYTLQPGKYFSEISILTNQPHNLNAQAVTDVTLYTLDKTYIDRMLEAPFFSVSLAKDLAIKFQNISKGDGFSFFDPSKGVQVKELGNLLPLSILTTHEILPLRMVDNELTIGMTSPESEAIYAVVGRYLHKYRVKLEIITTADFKKWLKEIEGEDPSVPIGRSTSVNLAKGDAVSVVNKVLKRGFENRASDIHFEPGYGHCTVRYRIDGVLRESDEKYSNALGDEVISRIKIMAQMDTTNKFTPQDGQLKVEFDSVAYAARISTLPSKFGETVVARLIRERSSVPPLSTLAPDPRVIQILQDTVNCKQGVFLVTGPTGSGKSTTLYSLIQELNRVEVSIISLEDPVEMTIVGTTQVEMNEKQGLTFGSALRSALRQDPNVIIIGEIRDEESAKIAFHAASTGHLVISTLHTNSSLSVVPRLLELGVTPGTLATTLIGASAQRLVRHNCTKCLTTRPVNANEVEILTAAGITPPEQVSFGSGCEECGGSGYHGRFPSIEIWEKTLSVEKLLGETPDVEHLTAELKKQGFETLYQYALRMVLNGLTTVEEVQRSLGTAVFRDFGTPAARKAAA